MSGSLADRDVETRSPHPHTNRVQSHQKLDSGLGGNTLIKTPEIEDQVMALESAANELEQALGLVVTKLEPILQHLPENKTGEGRPMQTRMSPLGERLQKIQLHIERMTTGVHATHSRLAV